MELETESEIKGWRVANVANDMLTSTVVLTLTSTAVGAFCLYIADDWFLRTALGVLLALLWKRNFQNRTNDRIVQARLAAAASQVLALNKLVAKYCDTIKTTAQHECISNASKDSEHPAAAAAADVVEEEELDTDSIDECSTPLLAECVKEHVQRRALISLSLKSTTSEVQLQPIVELTEKLRPSGAAEVAKVVNLIHGSRRVLQTHVIVRSGLIETLKNVVTEAAKIDKNCSLQLDGCVVFKVTENGVKMLKLDDISIPTIIQAECSAGVLSCIKGVRLVGVVVQATSVQLRTVVLKVTGREKRRGGLEILSCMEPLPMSNLDEVFVHASKSVKIDGHYVDVVSAAASIHDVQLRRAIRDWIPAVIMTICVAKGVWALARPSNVNLNFNYDSCAWIPPGLAIFLLQLLPARAEEYVKQGVKSVVRSIWGMYESLQTIRLESKLCIGPSTTVSSGATSSPRATKTTALEDAKPSIPEKPITDPHWQWSSYEAYGEESGPPKLLKEPTVTLVANTDPFQVVYTRKPNQQWPDVVSINLSSSVLVRVIQKLLPHKKDLQHVAKPSVLGKELFLVLDQLVNYQLTAEDVVSANTISSGEGGGGPVVEMGIAQLHVSHLIRFMKKEYKDVTVRVERMREEKAVPWDMLWAFFPPGSKVGYNCNFSKEQLFASVKSTNFSYNKACKYWKFDVVLDVYDYDGQSYRKCNITKEIIQYEGEQEFQKLDVLPLELSEQADTLEETCLANGRKFCSYVMKQKFLYMHYRGPLIFRRRNELFMCNADGRVMIDLASFAKMNPSYPMGNARPRRSVLHGNQITTCDIPLDANLVYAPALVYGFSFSQKQWGMFVVSGFSDINFNSSAFDNLVMDADEKNLLHNLVSQYLSPPKTCSPSEKPELGMGIDPIVDKGAGCIFLCYGPPGTGKTLTAESISEKLKRPLWSLSVSELGTNPSDLEATLVKVLDIAASWRAVLLLDEADVYLQSRTDFSVLNNAMTGVFLRLLEYYRGVLFLTTNRLTAFDEAFLSRISMFLNYKKLETETRELVWKKLLARAQVPGVTDQLISEVAEEDLNGRSIRNIIQLAHTCAKSRCEEFTGEHVKSVLKITAASIEVLRDCTVDGMYSDMLDKSRRR